MADGAGVMNMPILLGHPHGFGIGQQRLNIALFFLIRSEEVLCRVGSSVFYGWFCLSITPHEHIAVASTSLVLLCLLSVALCGVELGALELDVRASKSV